ncbi:glycosyltransferase family 4 protein [Natronoglomus mannanivorans]|uniref:Glycosyltransferase family 4 protein n=1 Tax=Natronoglomus mannanivorans TaxID=2979990 RepID=A0AAP2Z2V2_9EURY|nr:glycosyltransferase family 4 protein [Halobacteria archaeon AArc-xg1-1]
MKVLLLSGKLDSGGAPRVCHQIARHLPADVELHLAFLGGENGLVDRFEQSGISVERLADSPVSPAAARALDHHLRTHTYDLVHTHMLSAGVIGRPVATLHGIPVIHTIHTNYEMRPIQARLADVLTAPFGNLTVCVSASANRALPKHYLSETDVVYNCIDPDEVRNEAAVPWDDLEWTDNLDNEAPIVANVARYDPKKRRVDLIDGFQYVIRSVPDAQLVLTGRHGNRQRQLAKRAGKLGISDNVFFVGFVKNPQTVYHHADVIAFPSEAEGFSIGMLEAMVHERPVVASNIPAFVDALGDEYPAYAPVRTPEVLAETLCSVLLDSSYREELTDIMKERLERFSGDRAAKHYYELYQSLIDE